MRALRPPSTPATRVALLASLGISVACSAFDPNVGPLQRDAGPASTCELGASGYGSTLGAPSGQAAANDFCTAEGGTLESACDECEATSCCDTRVACYSDQGCSCADTALDACMAALGDASTKGAAACWATFAATSALASARNTCVESNCKAPCGLAN